MAINNNNKTGIKH